MSMPETALVVFLAASVGGALGARNASADAWKGFVIIAVSTLLTVGLFILFGVESPLLSFICSVVLAGVVGSILKLSGRQISIVIVGSILFGAIAGAIAGSIG